MPRIRSNDWRNVGVSALQPQQPGETEKAQPSHVHSVLPIIIYIYGIDRLGRCLARLLSRTHTGEANHERTHHRYLAQFVLHGFLICIKFSAGSMQCMNTANDAGRAENDHRCQSLAVLDAWAPPRHPGLATLMSLIEYARATSRPLTRS